jgi:hypothetical protein
MSTSFLRALPPDGAERDTFLFACVAAGRIDPPTWVRLRAGRIEVEVSADYLSIVGERVPMTAAVAQAAVDSLDALLPTPKIVEIIEEHAVIVPAPTWAPPPGQSRAAQTSAAVFGWCEEETEIRFTVRGVPPGRLVAGHRKDIVISDYMPAGVVVIFGARWPDGRRLQGVYPRPGTAGHGDFYEDYLHGVRAVRRRCWLDGRETTLDEILSGAHAALLGGPVARLRYSTSPTATSRPATSPSAVLRRGERGPAVAELQRLLIAAGAAELHADGIFGPKTEVAVKHFQAAHGLVVDGIAGPRTSAALRLASAPLPLSDLERLGLFGSFEWEPAPTAAEPGAIRILGGWVKQNIVTVAVPQLRGVRGAGASGLVTCHRLAVRMISRFFAAIERAGKLPLVLSFDGCWNPRRVRGGSSLSNHALGADFDINAQWNARATSGAPRGEQGSLVEIFPIAVDCGLGLGLGWSTPDPMHFGVREVA